MFVRLIRSSDKKSYRYIFIIHSISLVIGREQLNLIAFCIYNNLRLVLHAVGIEGGSYGSI